MVDETTHESTGENQMNKMLIPGAVVVIVIVITAAVFFMRGNQSSMQQETISPTSTQTQETLPTQTEASDITTPSSVKEFKVTGSNFKFDVPEIKVNMGDTVKIVFTSSSGTHDWKLDEFNAATNVLDAGQSETIEFIADKTGEFEYYCSVGQHRKMGMKGMLIVE